MKSHRRIRAAIASASFAVQCNAFALGYFARACPVADIPTTTKLPALALFEAIGDAPITSLTRVATYSTSEQYKYWVHEAITADYVNVRFYLFAEADLYVWDSRTIGTCGSGISSCVEKGWFFLKNYRSPGAFGWGATALSQETLKDSSFQVFFANRGSVYSQRAGDPNIVVYWPRFAGTGSGRVSDFFMVKSQHYYYDPVGKTYSFLGTYKAYDCNLSQWGLERR